MSDPRCESCNGSDTEDKSSRLNEKLQTELEQAFKPLGIVAYTNCCRLGCTGTYEEDDPDFRLTDKPGIYFFRLSLSGMNYICQPRSVSVYYSNFSSTMENWETEEAKINHWTSILGLSKPDFTVDKPQMEEDEIIIRFHKPLELEVEAVQD